MNVSPVPAEQTHEWLLKKHYAHTVPSVSYAFGLYENNVLIGCVTYGVPPSSPLKLGIAGKQWADKVLELNRLVVNDDSPKNSASFLVGQSLRLLPKPSIVVSYADTNQGHVGYIYQATNFIYTGLSAKRTNWVIEGMEGLHAYTIADLSRGQENRAEYMRETYGDKFKLEPRSRKHRYIFIVADKNTKKEIMANLKYPIEKYPKGDTQRYDASYTPPSQMGLFTLPNKACTRLETGAANADSESNPAVSSG
jgi:hypothetical protein